MALTSSEEKVEALRRELAARHHVVIGRDDPILILQTVNEILIRSAADELREAQTRALDAHLSRLELAAARWEDQAKALGERVLAAARHQSQELLQETVTRGRQLLDHAGAEVLQRQRTAATVHLCISLLALACALGSIVLSR